MATHPSLLVVDDEPLYCEACRRIFASQGFTIDKSNDATEGLSMAQQNDYAAVLLDVKMPTMDGLEFLEQLRTTKPDVPVILMTGFPSIPNAANAVRLRASDYVTKPFTPEEITKAVHQLLGAEAAESSGNGSAEPWEPCSVELRFHAESWLQPGTDGTVRAGAALPKSRTDALTEIHLPSIGEVVFQGLPLMSLVGEGQALNSVPSPISGVVVAVNVELAKNPRLLSSTPLDQAWAVCIAPTRTNEDMAACQPRTILLVNHDKASADRQEKVFRDLGCQVLTADVWDELAPMLNDNGQSLLVLDEASLGDEGPALVTRIKAEAPSLKILVVAAPGSESETDYRQRKIFYYAVEPFADNEITEILHAAFCPEVRPAPPSPGQGGASAPLRAFHFTNQHGHHICLLAPNGIIETGEGLGATLRQTVLDKRMPVEVYLGAGPLAPTDILKAAKTADRVFLLFVKDLGRSPGCLVRGEKGEYEWASGDSTEKVTSLMIQPNTDGTIASLPASTITALAARILDELTEA